MIKGVIIKELKKFPDERGWLSEFWRADEGKYQPAMGYVSVSKPDTVRGPHEHVNQTDYFIFYGPGDFELYLWDRREKSETRGEYYKTKVGESNCAMVVIPPGVVHAYKCVSDKDAWYINIPDRLYKGENKKEEVDEIRWEQDPNSLYKIE